MERGAGLRGYQPERLRLFQPGRRRPGAGAILSRLEKRDKEHQARWNKVWPDAVCQKYRRPEHEDFWLWSYDFYNAPVDDLRHIAALVGARV